MTVHPESGDKAFKPTKGQGPSALLVAKSKVGPEAGLRGCWELIPTPACAETWTQALQGGEKAYLAFVLSCQAFVSSQEGEEEDGHLGNSTTFLI